MDAHYIGSDPAQNGIVQNMKVFSTRKYYIQLRIAIDQNRNGS